MRAPRCGYCGWATGPGLRDERFVGHYTFCPSRLYATIRTADGIADQWRVIEEWARLAEALSLPGWHDMWHHMAWGLMQRADQLGTPFPIAADASELAGD
jgi:hypothetical protein